MLAVKRIAHHVKQYLFRAILDVELSFNSMQLLQLHAATAKHLQGFQSCSQKQLFYLKSRLNFSWPFKRGLENCIVTPCVTPSVAHLHCYNTVSIWLSHNQRVLGNNLAKM